VSGESFGSGERGSGAKRSRKRLIAPVDTAVGSRHVSIGISVEIALDNDRRRDSVEPLEGHLLRLAHVRFAKLALLLVVEVPVPGLGANQDGLGGLLEQVEGLLGDERKTTNHDALLEWVTRKAG
jgi:hypothetical protein